MHARCAVRVAGEGRIQLNAAALRHGIRDERRADVGLEVLRGDRGDAVGQTGDDAGIRAVGDEVGGFIRIVGEVEQLRREDVAHATTAQLEVLCATVHRIGELVDRDRCRRIGDERGIARTQGGGRAAGGREQVRPQIDAIEGLRVLRRHADGGAECREDIADPHVLMADHAAGQYTGIRDPRDLAQTAFIAVALVATHRIIERALRFIAAVVAKPDHDSVVADAGRIQRIEHAAHRLVHAIDGGGDEASAGVGDTEVLILRDQIRRGGNGAMDRVEREMQVHRLRGVTVLDVIDGLVREQVRRPAAGALRIRVLARSILLHAIEPPVGTIERVRFRAAVRVVVNRA